MQIVLALLSGANLLGVGGLYFRLGVAITKTDNLEASRIIQLNAHDQLARRVTQLETLVHKGQH